MGLPRSTSTVRPSPASTFQRGNWSFMLKRFNKRALISPALMALVAVTGGLVSRTAHAQATPNCKDVPNKVFVTGSSALQPAILTAPTGGKSIAQILAEDTAN